MRKYIVVLVLVAMFVVCVHATAQSLTITGQTNIAPVGSPAFSNMTRGAKYEMHVGGLPDDGGFGNPQSGVPTVYLGGVAQSSSSYVLNTNIVRFIFNIPGVWMPTPKEVIGVQVKTSTGLVSNAVGNITALSDPALYGCNPTDSRIYLDTGVLVGRCATGTSVEIPMSTPTVNVYLKVLGNGLKPGSTIADVTNFTIASFPAEDVTVALNSSSEWEIRFRMPRGLPGGPQLITMKINGEVFSFAVDILKKKRGQVTSQ